MALLLLQIQKMDQKQFERRLVRLYQSCSINGPRAVAWGLRKLGEITPPGDDRRFWLAQADAAMDDAATMLKLKRGWMEYGDHPWWVVHAETQKPMARYNSDTCLYHKGRWVC